MKTELLYLTWVTILTGLLWVPYILDRLSVRGLTDTMPLQVEILYNEYDFVGAFAVASLLTFLAIVTLVVKKLVEWKTHRERRAAAPAPARSSP